MASGVLQQWNDTIAAAGNALNYIVGQCTRWVAENASWVPKGWGNAIDWFGNAQKSGFQTGQTPVPGAIAVWGKAYGDAGHVAIVQSVDQAGGFVVSEENYLNPGTVDLRNVTTQSGLLGFIYPPGGSGGNPLSNVPVVGGVIDAGQNLASIGPAIAGLPAQIGHGLADALSASISNAGTAAKNNIVPLIVALVVAVVLFTL